MPKSEIPDGPFYEIRVADNFRYMDKEAEYSAGFFSSGKEAIERCKLIVEGCLQECGEGGKSATEIVACYRYFGDDPYLVARNDAPAVMFSGWDYADRRARDFAREPSSNL